MSIMGEERGRRINSSACDSWSEAEREHIPHLSGLSKVSKNVSNKSELIVLANFSGFSRRRKRRLQTGTEDPVIYLFEAKEPRKELKRRDQ